VTRDGFAGGKISLAVFQFLSDECVCADKAQILHYKGLKPMTNAETSTTNEAANNGAEQGATVAPEKAPSKKGASHKKGTPKGNKGIKGNAQHTNPFDESKVAGNARGSKVARAQAPKKMAPAKKAKGDPKAKTASGRGNKKAEVIAMMKRAKGATLSEIMAATGWQKHTVRGFVSILGSKGGEKIESSKNASGDRSYRITR